MIHPPDHDHSRHTLDGHSLMHALLTRRILTLLILAMLSTLSPCALAQVDTDQATEPTPSELIESAQDALAPIDGLSDLELHSEGRVVVITGTADDSDAITQANTALASTLDPDMFRNEIALSMDINERFHGAAERMSQRLDRMIGYLPLLPVALAVLLIALILAWIVGKTDAIFARLIRNPFLQGIAQRAVQLGVLLIGLLIALEILDAMALIGGVLGAAGVLGLAIGFAFRDLVENYIASILLSLRQPFRPKDHVIIDGQEGLVTSMNTRTTVLTTFDGNIVRIPNAVVFKTTLTNYTTDSRRRFSFTVGVGYDVDLRLAIQTGIEVLSQTDGVMQDPEPIGIITELGDSSITLKLFAWVNQDTHSFSKVRSFAMQRVKSRFDELDIDMPEPSYKVRLDTGADISIEHSEPAATRAPSQLHASEQQAPQSMAPDQTVIEMAESEASSTENLLDGDARTE